MTEKAQFNREEFAKLKRETWNSTDYGSWFKPARGQVIDTLEKEALARGLQGKSYETALDVGIGNGRLLPIYAPNARKIVGLDISSEQLEMAMQTAKEHGINLEVKLCNEASKLELPDASFDLIICSRVLQHVYDWRASVAEFARVLKPQGDLLLLTYNRFSIYGLQKLYQHKFVNPTKGRFQNPIALSRELKKNGLRIDYSSGALIGQPELFSKNLSGLTSKFIQGLEKLSRIPPVKYLGGRQVIRAKKIA